MATFAPTVQSHLRKKECVLKATHVRGNRCGKRGIQTAPCFRYDSLILRMDKRRFPTHASDLGGCSHLKIVDKKPNDLFFFFAFKAKPIVRSPEGQETSWPVCAVTKIPSFLEPSQWGWGESGQRGRKSPFQSQEK